MKNELYQSIDGVPHMAYYDKNRLLSFVWDGHSEAIEVSYGGYGEPVVAYAIPYFVKEGLPYEVLSKFKYACKDFLPKWDKEYRKEYPAMTDMGYELRDGLFQKKGA